MRREAREKVEVLAAQRLEQAAIQILLHAEVAQASGSHHADA